MKISLGMQALVGVLVVIASYFIGNINTAVMLSRMKGKDIRTCGSGNPGTMNMIRTFGKPMGAITLVLDVAKGCVPALLGWLFMGDGEFLMLGHNRIGLYVAGLSVEVGHIYPVLMKFKGGKGIATVFGVLLTAQPMSMFVFFGLGVAFLIVTKIGSLTSFLMLCSALTLEGWFATTAPDGLWCTVLSFGGYTPGAAVGIAGSAIVFAMFALSMFAHRKNFIKLFSGMEGRVVLKKSKKQKPAPDCSIVFDGILVAE